MTSSILRTSAIAIALVAAGAALMADPPRPAPPPAPPGTSPNDPNAVPQTFRAKQVLGMKINMQNNTAIGTVEDLVFTDAGDLEYLIVSTADNKLVTVPWTAAHWAADAKMATVNITPEQFKVVPTYTATTYPQFFTPTYRTEVHKHYGVTPRELRRIDRRIIRQ